MSTRRPAQPDLALTDVRPTWTPKPGDRVRRAHQTSHRALTEGTARVLWMKREGRVDVSVDPRPRTGETQETWQVWFLDDTRLVREAAVSAHKDDDTTERLSTETSPDHEE